MKIISILKAQSDEGIFPETRGTVTAVHDESIKGFFRKIRLTGNAVVISKGEATVVFPLTQLLRVAGEQEPQLLPPPPAAPAETKQTSKAKTKPTTEKI
jgi:hypothetical protein